MESFSSAPALQLIQNMKPLDSVIKCDQVIKKSYGFVYSSCRILSSGNFNIIIKGHSFYQTSLAVIAGIKEILTIKNKTSMAVGELFEVQPNILGDDNLTITGEAEIEIINTELIGLKKIKCIYYKCIVC